MRGRLCGSHRVSWMDATSWLPVIGDHTFDWISGRHSLAGPRDEERAGSLVPRCDTFAMVLHRLIPTSF